MYTQKHVVEKLLGEKPRRRTPPQVLSASMQRQALEKEAQQRERSAVRGLLETILTVEAKKKERDGDQPVGKGPRKRKHRRPRVAPKTRSTARAATVNDVPKVCMYTCMCVCVCVC